ncbi:MAG: hypothetical protein ABW168_02100 [Sedimenticola sp.]
MNYKRVEELFDILRKITPLKVHNFGDQTPGNEKNIFVLEKNGSRYYLLPSGASNPGSYISYNGCIAGKLLYAILASNPNQVLVGAPYYNANFAKEFQICGHTSLTMRKDVVFAGELFFASNELTAWTSCSGHYMPDSKLRFSNLTPNVKRLLPLDLFYHETYY